MKKLFFTAMMLVAGSSLFAQAKFGLKAGVNFAEQEFKSEGISVSPSSNTSFHITGFSDLPISEKFSIQPGLSLTGKGFKLESEGNSITTNLMYLELPVNAVVKFPAGGFGKVFLGAGPYAAYGISGKVKTKGDAFDGLEDDDTNLFSEDGGYKKGDFGFNFLGGVELNSGILLNINYGLGVLNTIREDAGEEGTTAKNRVFSISVGFAF